MCRSRRPRLALELSAIPAASRPPSSLAQGRGRPFSAPARAKPLPLTMLATLAGLLPAAAAPLHGAAIAPADIIALPQHLIGSGNGTLDLRLFTFSGSEIRNRAGSFNGDNANNALPQGGGADRSTFVGSYVTTAGDLKAYYSLNFSQPIDQVVLFLDLNETGPGASRNTLQKLDVILNPSAIQGNPNPLADVSSAAQAAIHQLYSGGTKIASLASEPAANLPITSQGAGFADYAIQTHIDLSALNDTDVLLFNLSMGNLSAGAEEIFLSGAYAPCDLPVTPGGPAIPVPEPTGASLLLLPAALLARRRRTLAAPGDEASSTLYS